MFLFRALCRKDSSSPCGVCCCDGGADSGSVVLVSVDAVEALSGSPSGGVHPEGSAGHAGRASSFDAAGHPEGRAGLLQNRGPVVIGDCGSYSGQWVIYRGPGKQEIELREGEGVMTRADGGRYVGQFLANRAHGRGRYFHSCGDVYEGEWRDDEAHGQGRFTLADGSCYEGGFARNLRHGLGVEAFSDGSRYEGQHVAGRKEGEGVFTSPDGTSFSGQFLADRMVTGVCRYSDGRICKMLPRSRSAAPSPSL